MKLIEAFNKFSLALYADQRKESTIAWYASMLKDYLAKHGAQDISEITVQSNREWISEFRRRTARYVGAAQRPEKTGGPSDSSISSEVRALNGFWSWLYREELIARNPMKGIRLPPPKKHAPRAISESDMIAIFDTCNKDQKNGTAEHRMLAIRDRAILAVMADTGCRVGGLCSISLRTLNIDRRTLIVHEKRSTVRQIPFSNYTAMFLSNWLQERPLNLSHDFCFVNVRTNEALTTNGVYTMLKRRKQLSGATGPVHPHGWREFFARGYLESGGDVATLARLLGNSPEVVLRNYSIFTSKEVTDSHEKYSPFARLIDEKGGS